MTLFQITSYMYLNYVRALGRTELYQPTYNPQKLPLIRGNVAARGSDDRVAFMTKHIDFTSVDTYIDIGSQLGYMVLSIADHYDLTAIGIDHDLPATRYARATAELGGVSNALFMHRAITPDSINKIPKASVISFLNVFHHIAWHQSFGAAEEVLATICSKATYLVFETGMPTEATMAWASSLDNMLPDPDKWIEAWFNKRKAKVLAKMSTPTHLSDVERTLYIVKTA